MLMIKSAIPAKVLLLMNGGRMVSCPAQHSTFILHCMNFLTSSNSPFNSKCLRKQNLWISPYKFLLWCHFSWSNIRCSVLSVTVKLIHEWCHQEFCGVIEASNGAMWGNTWNLHGNDRTFLCKAKVPEKLTIDLTAIHMMYLCHMLTVIPLALPSRYGAAYR